MRWVLKSTATSPNITETNKKLITTKSEGVNLENLMAVQFTNYLLVKNIRIFFKELLWGIFSSIKNCTILLNNYITIKFAKLPNCQIAKSPNFQIAN